ncbi:MAG: cell division protein SepF [Ruminococcaceae bacterium]|nr:cell division protein SepF [Oscillospiraceae bacterium]
MGIMDKIKRATTGEENYDEMYGNDIYDDYGYNVFTESGEENGEDQNFGPATSFGPEPGTGISSFNNANPAGGISIGGAALEMKVVKPEHFESVPQIADHLLNKRTVVLNLENTNKETARRLIDFLSGVAYSIDGSLKKIASNAYVITPNNVDVGDAQLKSGARPAAPKAEETPESVAEQFGDM